MILFLQFYANLFFMKCREIHIQDTAFIAQRRVLVELASVRQPAIMI